MESIYMYLKISVFCIQLNKDLKMSAKNWRPIHIFEDKVKLSSNIPYLMTGRTSFIRQSLAEGFRGFPQL